MNEPEVTSAFEAVTAYQFPSLTVLKQAHLKLLAKEAEPANLEGTKTAFLENVRDFMLRARATGRILEDDKERGIAQTLINYWATVLFRAGVPDDTVPQTSLLDLDENASRDLDESQCPYCGLQAYTEETAHLFFGRKHVVHKWLEILSGATTILIVLGPSGSGKTSLVRAGLLPALRNKGGPGGSEWKIREAFLQKMDSADPLLVPLQEDAGNEPELLVVHRLDEGLLSCERKLQRKLITAFKEWLSEPGKTRKAVFVGRVESAALVAHWLRDGDLTEKSQRVFVPPLDARELRAVIEAPAERIGLRFDEGLVDTLVNEFLGDPAALALLQFVLLNLWDARERNRITWTAYHAIGGGRGAVETTADSIYLGKDFSDADRELTKKIFLRLVRPTLTSALEVNRVTEAVLAPSANLKGSVEKIVERFKEARLLQVDVDEHGARQVEIAQEALIRKWPRFLLWLEDARQELLERRRIADAAAQWREGGRNRSSLWTGILLDRALVLRDQLSPGELEFVLASRRAVKRRLARVFVALGVLLLVLSVVSARAYYRWRETKATLNTERGERLLEGRDPSGAFLFFNQATNDDPSDNTSLRYRLWRWLIFPFRAAKHPAEAQKRINQLRLGAAWWQLPRLKHLVYLPELTRSVLSPNGEYLAGTSRTDLSLWHLLADGKAEESKPLSKHQPTRVMWASFSEDPKVPLLAIALASADGAGKPVPGGKVLVFDPKTRQPVGKPIVFPDGVPQKVWFNPRDDKRLLIIKQFTDRSLGSAVSIWNIETGAQEGDELAYDLPVNWAAFSANGELIVTAAGALQGGGKGEAKVWDWKRKYEVHWQTDGPLAYVEFDAEGNRVVTSEGADEANRGAARVWNILWREPGQIVAAMEAATAPLTHHGAVTRARFSPDGLWVASAGRDRTTRLWHIRTQKEVLRFQQGGDVNDVMFSPDGRYLASAGRDRTARVWEVATGQPIFVLNHSETVGWLAYSTDGRSLVTSTKHVAQVWSADRAEPKRPIIQAKDSVVTTISGDGQRVLTASGWRKDEHTKMQVWDTNTGELIAGQKLGENEKVRFASLDREGKRGCVMISESSGNNRLQLFQIDRTNKQFSELAAFEDNAIPQADILSAQFDEGGRTRIALILRSKNEKSSSVALAEINPKSLRLLPHQDAAALVTRVKFSPKGTYLLACFTQPPAVAGRAKLWRLDSESAAPFELQHDTEITTADFDPNESSILTGSTDDNAKLWRITADGLTEGIVLGGGVTSTHTADLTCVLFSPDGRRAVTAAKDQTAILWEVPEGAQSPKRLAVLQHSASVNNAVFSAGGERILTFSGEPKLRAWSAISGDLLGLFQPTGEVLQAGFAPDGNSVFAIAQNLVSRQWSGDSDDEEFAREIRPMSWTFKPLTMKPGSREKLGELIAARELTNTELASTRTGLEKAKTDGLRQLWQDQSPQYIGLFPSPMPPEKFHLAAAEECEAIKEWGAAAWHLTQVLKATHPGPERAKLLLRRADSYAQADNFAESLPRCIADHEEAISLGQNGAADYVALAEAHLNYGNTFPKADEAAGQWDAAIAAYRKATSLEPKNVEFLIELGEALAGRRRFPEAENEFKRALQLGNNPSVSARLAMVGWLRGDEAGKKQYREICMSLKDPGGAHPLLWPAVVTNAFEQDKEFLETVVKRAQDLVKRAPVNFYHRNTLGAALYRAGHFEEAIQELERARATCAADKANALSQRYDHAIRVPISPSPEGRPVDWVFLAMANAKLKMANAQPNQPNLAWDWLRKLRETPELSETVRLMNSGQLRAGMPRSYPVYYTTLALELLYDEAFGILRQMSAPPRSPAPSPTPAR
jgi:WD40 repeat protein/Flp pilus assembly protein TadD